MRWKSQLYIVFLIAGLITATGQSHAPVIQPGRLVIKLKPDSNQRIAPDIIAKSLDALSIKPYHTKKASQRTGPSILDGIYIIELDENAPIRSISDSLKQINGIAYAEPIYIEPLLYVPNDPEAQPGASQSYLEIISAYDAWDIEKGSPETIIGIIDTGMDLLHEDLENNYHYSTDIVNGIDDDGNGYIDDYLGYDFADRDNDPQADASQHGTRVGGIAGAQSNNGLGIAGVGLNCTVSPLKAYSSVSNFIFGGYDAIIYAADNGYSVVNLSWGSANSYSQFNQDIITYAVLEKDLAVVAAAGNSNIDEPYYPASYDYVLSVAATDDLDQKSSFSTYHPYVDLSAPGVSIYSTINNDNYGKEGGTSYASPMVAGAVALVRSKYPELSAIEAMERVKATTDPIYMLPANEPYLGKLGTGRLNVAKALGNKVAVSMESELTQLKSPFDELFFGDTIQLYFKITNLIDPVYFAQASLFTTSPYLITSDQTFDLGYMTKGEVEHIGPFEIIIAENTPSDSKLNLVLHLTDDDRFETWHAYTISTAPDYFSIHTDSMRLTVAANGDLGYRDDGFLRGNGFASSIQLANQLGYFLQYNDSLLLDNLPIDWKAGIQEKDFFKHSEIKPAINRDGSRYAFSRFSSLDSTILIEQSVLLWDSLPGLALGLKYRIVNAGQDTIRNLKSGIMVDYNLVNRALNQGRFDGNQTSYVSYGDNKFAGLRTIETGSHHSLFAVDSLPASINDSIKSELITSHKDSLGFDNTLDIGIMGRSSLIQLVPGQSWSIQFALGVGDSLAQLYHQLDLAQTRMNQFNQNPPITDVFYSCLGGRVDLVPESGKNFYFFRDPSGLDTLSMNNSLTIASVTSDTLIYIRSIENGYYGPMRAISIQLIDDFADFKLPADTIYIGDYPSNKINLADASILPTSWSWDFGNGTQAIGIQNPTPVYNKSGTYPITLHITNQQGCESSITKNLTVLSRPAPPSYSILGYCPGEKLLIENTDTLRYFVFRNATDPVLEGTTLELGPYEGDTLIYLSRIKNGLESIHLPVIIKPNEIGTTFQFLPVTDSLNGNFAQFELTNNQIKTATWLMDSTYTSHILTPVFEINHNSIRLDILYTTDSLCSVVFSDSLFLTTPPPPAITDIDFCLGDPVMISPEGGQNYGFYLDQNLESALYKGSELQIDTITTPTNIYISILDEIIPGPSQLVTVNPIDYQINIQASSDTIYLDQTRAVDFSLDVPAQSINWSINGVLESNTSLPRLFFNELGVFEVTASAINNLGCIANDTLLIYTFEELIIPLGITEQLGIYPIPTTHFIQISTIKNLQSLVIIDATGKSYPVKVKADFQIDVSHIPEGLFILKATFTDGTIEKIKGIKQSNR